jgi:hypothetical protein
MLKIIVEGNDKIFIEKFISLKLAKTKDVDFEVINAGGWTTLNLLSAKLNEFTDSGDKICLVFDSDTSQNQGGFAIRLKQLQEKISELGVKLGKTINVEIFLWPNNNQDGDFEVVLEEISNNKRKVIYSCFNDYESCIQTKLDANSLTYNLPLRKSRIFAYTETLPESKTKKKNIEWKTGDYLFEKIDYWDLDSAFLKPLHDFLSVRL